MGQAQSVEVLADEPSVTPGDDPSHSASKQFDKGTKTTESNGPHFNQDDLVVTQMFVVHETAPSTCNECDNDNIGISKILLVYESVPCVLPSPTSPSAVTTSAPTHQGPPTTVQKTDNGIHAPSAPSAPTTMPAESQMSNSASGLVAHVKVDQGIPSESPALVNSPIVPLTTNNLKDFLASSTSTNSAFSKTDPGSKAARWVQNASSTQDSGSKAALWRNNPSSKQDSGSKAARRARDTPSSKRSGPQVNEKPAVNSVNTPTQLTQSKTSTIQKATAHSVSVVLPASTTSGIVAAIKDRTTRSDRKQYLKATEIEEAESARKQRKVKAEEDITKGKENRSTSDFPAAKNNVHVTPKAQPVVKTEESPDTKENVKIYESPKAKVVGQTEKDPNAKAVVNIEESPKPSVANHLQPQVDTGVEVPKRRRSERLSLMEGDDVEVPKRRRSERLSMMKKEEAG